MKIKKLIFLLPFFFQLIHSSCCFDCLFEILCCCCISNKKTIPFEPDEYPTESNTKRFEHSLNEILKLKDKLSEPAQTYYMEIVFSYWKEEEEKKTSPEAVKRIRKMQGTAHEVFASISGEKELTREQIYLKPFKQYQIRLLEIEKKSRKNSEEDL